MKNQPDYETDNSKELKDIVVEDLLKMSLNYCKKKTPFYFFKRNKIRGNSNNIKQNDFRRIQQG